jgi:hypothetical protein
MSMPTIMHDAGEYVIVGVPPDERCCFGVYGCRICLRILRRAKGIVGRELRGTHDRPSDRYITINGETFEQPYYNMAEVAMDDCGRLMRDEGMTHADACAQASLSDEYKAHYDKIVADAAAMDAQAQIDFDELIAACRVSEPAPTQQQRVHEHVSVLDVLQLEVARR